MNRVLLRFAFLLLVFLFSRTSGAETAPLHNLMPVPADAVWLTGSIPVDASFSVVVNGTKDERVAKGLERFLARLSKRTGLAFTPDMTKVTLRIECQSKGLPVQSVREDESYSLDFSTQPAVLSAPTPLGVLHGLETLLQLVEKQNGQYVIPAVTIHDKPRFAWRGLLIDVCRHWMPVEVIERNLDGMAEAKLNVLHWHLSENHGFRVESKKFPKLQGMGSDGNYYTQEQVKEIVAYARDRGIRVVPEFDIPGHSTAWLVGYPELGTAPGPYSIEKKFGVLDQVMDPTNEELYKFLKTFIGEMTTLFPDEYFHIGGDEVSGKDWNASTKTQAFMYEHHLKTNDDLQTYFNSRLLPILTQDHRKMVGWDEILNPKLPKTIVVQSWRGIDALSDAAKKGYDVLLSNGYYLDNIRPASFHYGVDPSPEDKGLSDEQKAHILGGEACMWSEFVTPETIDSRIWPRTLAVAERLWSPASVKDVDDMYRRLNVESARLDELGLMHNSNYLPMLQKLIGDQPVDSLKVLADVVEPVKLYMRTRGLPYTTDTPLNRLVDAARPESETARVFRADVDSYLKNAPSLVNGERLVVALKFWRSNHKVLGPILEKSGAAIENASESRDLSESAELGLEALKYLEDRNEAPVDWLAKSMERLDSAQQPHAEVEIAAINPIRKLVLAAGNWDKLKTMDPAAWNKGLDDAVDKANPKPRGW